MMNYYLYLRYPMLVEFRHLEGKILEINALVQFGEVTLDFQEPKLFFLQALDKFRCEINTVRPCDCMRLQAEIFEYVEIR